MQTTLQFGPILAHLDRLLQGLGETVLLSLASILFGTLIGMLGAVGRAFGPRWLSWLIAAYVELIRNTPLLIQLYVVFFSLPLLGFKLKIACPAIYHPDMVDLARAQDLQGQITLTDDPREAVRGADVVAADTWVSMGDTDHDERLAALERQTGYRPRA